MGYGKLSAQYFIWRSTSSVIMVSFSFSPQDILRAIFMSLLILFCCFIFPQWSANILDIQYIIFCVYSLFFFFFFSLGTNSTNSFVLLPCQHFSELFITLKPGLCVLSPTMPSMLVLLLLQSQCTSISKNKTEYSTTH